MNTRPVYIEKTRHGFFVLYAIRAKGQHHFAAQFDLRRPDGSERTLADVEQWVRQQPNLLLIEKS